LKSVIGRKFQSRGGSAGASGGFVGASAGITGVPGGLFGAPGNIAKAGSGIGCGWALEVCLFLCVIACRTVGYSQTIEYSKQNTKAPYSDFIQLVPNIDGKHHLLCFAKNKKVTLFVYNSQLQLESNDQLQLPWQEFQDINIIPFSNFYYVYLHQQGSTSHELWKVDAGGILTALTSPFTQLVDTLLSTKTATLQLVNRNNKLVVIANTYYPNLRQIGTTVTEADGQLQIISSKRVYFHFERSDRLKHVMLTGNDLLILKTSRDSAGNLLQIIKANVETGDIAMNAFNSGLNAFINPISSYNPADSTFVVYSMIERTVFITKLGYALDEKVPVMLLKSQFKNNVGYNFLHLQEPSKWLVLQAPGRIIRFDGGRTTTFYPGRTQGLNYPTPGGFAGDRLMNRGYTGMNPGSFQGIYNYPYSPYTDLSAPAIPIRFSTVNRDFGLLGDSVVLNDKSSNTIQATQASQVVLNRKSYLFIGQQFGNNRQGLLKVDADNGVLTATDIRVYDRYEYSLQQLQAVDGRYILLPYKHKRELGLVKISFE
jgi:hypothetical protein